MGRYEIVVTTGTEPVVESAVHPKPSPAVRGWSWLARCATFVWGGKITRVGADRAPAAVLAAPALLAGLELTPGQPHWLCFGPRRVQVCFRPEPSLAPDRLDLPPAVAVQLCLPVPVPLTVYRQPTGAVSLGPLVGLVVPGARLGAMVCGELDPLCYRYAQYAREVGAVLVFFSPRDLRPDDASTRGYRWTRTAGGGWEWAACRLPVPRVVYAPFMDLAEDGEAAHIRTLARNLPFRLLDHPTDVNGTEVLAWLQQDPEMAQYLPCGPSGEEVPAQAPAQAPAAERPAATYLGNPFDICALAQRNGRGEWVVSGLVARLAPVGGAPAGPADPPGGRVAPADQALRHAFPKRWSDVVKQMNRITLQAAHRIDGQTGSHLELGLHLAVFADGTVRLITASHNPFRESLMRLRDPLVTERIDRYPIHATAYLDMTAPG